MSLGVFGFVISVSVSRSHPHRRRRRLPLRPAPPLSITAYQGAMAGSEHLRTLGKFHAGPLIKNVPFNFFPRRTFEVPPSTCKPGRDRPALKTAAMVAAARLRTLQPRKDRYGRIESGAAL